MMMLSFHKLFCELGAMCKSNQLFPCTVVTRGQDLCCTQLGWTEQAGKHSQSAPGKGTGCSSLRAAVGWAGSCLWIRTAWSCPTHAVSSSPFFPVLCKGKEVHKPALILVWPITGISQVATFDGTKKSRVNKLKNWHFSCVTVCWRSLPKAWPGDCSYNDLSSTRNR